MLKQKRFKFPSSNTRNKDKTSVVYNGPGNRDISAAAHTWLIRHGGGQV